MPQNRTRSKALTLRLTPEEQTFFTQQKQKSNIPNQTDFFLACLTKKPIIVIEDLKPLLIELKRQGVNLNQIAKHLNQGLTLTQQSIETTNTAIKNCNQAYKKLLDMELK